MFGCGNNNGEIFVWDTAEDKKVVESFAARVSENIRPRIEDVIIKKKELYLYIYIVFHSLARVIYFCFQFVAVSALMDSVLQPGEKTTTWTTSMKTTKICRTRERANRKCKANSIRRAVRASINRIKTNPENTTTTTPIANSFSSLMAIKMIGLKKRCE